MTKVAVYCRLSDEDRGKHNSFEDSESIQNQKSMLVSYATEKGWDIYKIYSDEDYSGADRNRPEFNKLLEDAERRKFDIVLCKTQSRFSRDMEVVEKYIHNLFPQWNIRFISLVDNADTEVKGNKKARQINGLINEWFLEDLSDNIRATLKHKKEKGEFTGAFAPYGYKKSPQNKNLLIIDPPAAQVVKEIFERFANGESYAKIAAALNTRAEPNPLHYKWENGFKLHCPHHNAMCHLWSRDTIRKMVRNEVYIGTLVQGTVQNISYKNSKKRLVEKENWIKVENAHEAIIDSEVWARVKSKLKSRARCQKYDGTVHIFSQKVFCAECGNIFHKNITNGYQYLRCKTIGMDKSFCSNRRRMRLDELARIILAEFNKLIKKYKNDTYLKSSVKLYTDAKSKLRKLQSEIDSLNMQIKRKEGYFKKLYEDKLGGIITDEEFLSLKDGFQKDMSDLEKRISYLNSKKDGYEKNRDCMDIQSLIEQYDKSDSLTRPVIDEFIEKIKIGAVDEKTNTRKVEIMWTF
ncbi:MAG: Recombinase [Firmicutes bacterium ADurb.Bin193]|nr:MAG: Recombinase [Firmicutes bacterium ADurb.Bin193]